MPNSPLGLHDCLNQLSRRLHPIISETFHLKTSIVEQIIAVEEMPGDPMRIMHVWTTFPGNSSNS